MEAKFPIMKVNWLILLFGCLLAYPLHPVLAQTDESPDSFEEESEEEVEEEKDPGPAATDETSAQIIALNHEARGGLDKIKAITTLRLTGTMREGKSDFNLLIYRKAPNKYRVEQYFRKLGREYRTIRVYDGETAWKQEVSPEKKNPQIMPAGEAKQFMLETDFYGPLVDWEEKGHKFAYTGEAKVGERSAYLIKAKINKGPVVYYYFDAQNFLMPRFGFSETFAGSTFNADYFVTNFKKVNDVWMEESLEYTAPRTGVYKTIDYDRIEANIDVPDSLFAMPKSKEFWLKQKE